MTGVIREDLTGAGDRTAQLLLAAHVLVERMQRAFAPDADPEVGDPTVERVAIEAAAFRAAVAQVVPVKTARGFLALGDLVTRAGEA